MVIAYIHNDARRFHVYVGNRVQHVRNHTSPEQWHHVPGRDNPEDEASRSLTASQLLDNRRWFRGPEFLWKDNVPLLNTVQPTQLPTNDVEEPLSFWSIFIVPRRGTKLKPLSPG